MISNFDEIKKQLEELSEVINAFKSEAVQLRVLELVLGGAPTPGLSSPRGIAPRRQAGAGLKSKTRPPRGTPPAGSPGPRGAKASRRPGGSTTLSGLCDSGFFREPKTLKSVIDHCKTDMALNYKQSDFSGVLARYVRDGKLKRAKNEEGQYEYTSK